MSDIIIKYFFIFLYSIYIYNHLLNRKILKNIHWVIYSLLSLVLSLITYTLKLYFPAASLIVSIMSLWMIVYPPTASPQLSFIATTISFGISYGFFTFSSSIILLFLMPLCYHMTIPPYILVMLLTGILEAPFVLLLFKPKRFRKGMPFLYSTKITNSGTILCLFCLIVLTYMQAKTSPSVWIALAFPALFIIVAFILIYWWQSQLTKSYRNRLQALELASLRTELRDKTDRLNKLTKENTEIGRLIHKDNKLIPAMENAVYEYLSSDFSDTDTMIARGNMLLNELRQLSENRHQVLSTFSTVQSRAYATGIVSLDALLAYMHKKAELANINFTVNTAFTPLTSLSATISNEDLVHLLADLIENAIISVSGYHTRNIQLQIYQYNNYPVIELSDSGAPFAIPVLMNWGIQPYTTHSQTGGTGTGLMDIWNIKDKYRASLHISEYKEGAPFCKKIDFLLDKRNQYLISTWRQEEILSQINRPDIRVLANIPERLDTKVK